MFEPKETCHFIHRNGGFDRCKRFPGNIRRYIRTRKEVGKPNRTWHEINFPHVTWWLWDNDSQTKIIPRCFTTTSKYHFISTVSIERPLAAKITSLILWVFRLLVGWHKKLLNRFPQNLDGRINRHKVGALLPKCTFISRSSAAGNVFRTSAHWPALRSRRRMVCSFARFQHLDYSWGLFPSLVTWEAVGRDLVRLLATQNESSRSRRLFR